MTPCIRHLGVGSTRTIIANTAVSLLRFSDTDRRVEEVSSGEDACSYEQSESSGVLRGPEYLKCSISDT